MNDLQRFIRRGIEDGALVFPAGDFDITETIDFVAVVGVRVQGAGQVYQPRRTPTERQTTRLNWRGPIDQPMIRGAIRHGVFRDFSAVSGRVEILAGGGTGLCNFDRVGLIGRPAGVKFGSALNANAADSTFRDCQFIQCDAPIELTTSQNVNYAVERSMFYRTPRCVLVAGGGLVTLDGCYMHSPAESMIVFDVRGDGTKTGSQNGMFTVRNLMFDAGSNANPTPAPILVRDTSRATGRSRQLHIDRLHAPRGFTAVLSDSAQWTVNGEPAPSTPEPGNE